MAKCNNTMTFCDLSDLWCGKTYNVSVFSKDESCSSVESNKTYMRTGITNNEEPACDFLHYTSRL